MCRFLRKNNENGKMAYPGGECAADVVKRADPVLKQLVKTGYERVAVVTHGGLNPGYGCMLYRDSFKPFPHPWKGTGKTAALQNLTGTKKINDLL